MNGSINSNVLGYKNNSSNALISRTNDKANLNISLFIQSPLLLYNAKKRFTTQE